ncbi:S1 family peptidase [Pseudomonas silesiensis]
MQDLSFEAQMGFITARILVQLPDGRSSIGTGFLFLVPSPDGSGTTKTMLISNRHVFVDPKAKITISFNRKKSDGTPDYGNTIDFIQDNFEDIYYSHPDQTVDLACVNVSQISHTDAYFQVIGVEFFKHEDFSGVHPGEKVFFVGYPENRYDIINNLPLIRTGTIASIPSIDFNGKGQIVLDAQVFQGSSGSPVFCAKDGNYFLAGVISETMIRHAQLQTMNTNLAQVGVSQILGLGIVVKQRHVKELLSLVQF